MKRSNITKILAILLTVVSAVGLLCSCGRKTANNGTQPPKEIAIDDLSVRDYVGANGMVTAGNPYVANIGLDILKKGGNAFDASVAVAYAMGVAEPDATGIAGGGILLAYNAETKTPLFYNFREFAPSGAHKEDFTKRVTNENCSRDTAVPTFVAGFNKVLEESGSGKFTLADLLAPSIKLAKEGITVTPALAQNIADNYNTLDRSYDEICEVFLKDFGISPLDVGDKLVQTDLANTLQYIADNGAEGFYTGALAEKIVEASRQKGGLMTMDDMRYAYENYPRKGDVIKGTYRGYDILTSSSPSTGGLMLIEMLNMLENVDDITTLGHNSAEYINLIATVMQLAYGDKEKYMADSYKVNVPIKGLTSKEYAKKRFEKYTAGHAYLGALQGDTPYGNPMPYNGESIETLGNSNGSDHFSTTSFSVMDSLGNTVTCTQTINNFFGCGIVPKGCGFFLNNEMKDFSFDIDSINCVEPYKQPASYMAPTVILKDNKPFATVGSPGGSRIPSALLQVILNITDFGMDMQSAINMPRVYCYTTSVKDTANQDKPIYLEKALKDIDLALISMNYDVIYQGYKDFDLYFGGVQGIKVEGANLHGGADFRRDGKALGY